MKVLYYSSVDIATCPDRIRRSSPWLFRESCKRHGIVASNIRGRLNGKRIEGRDFVMKLLHRALGPMGSEVAFLTDAWDVLFLCPISEIDVKYKSFGTPIVFQMESNLYPEGLANIGGHPPSPTRYRYINGGGMIGRADAILSLYDRCWLDPRWNNQYALNRWLILHPEEFEGALDYRCEIWQCLYDNKQVAPPIMDTLHAANGRVINTETKSMPCVIHGNGHTSADVEKIWSKLNLEQMSR